MAPPEEEEGYDPAYSAAVNISSASTGILIPPSGPLILFSLVSGGTSIAALFMAGYIPGFIMGLSVTVDGREIKQFLHRDKWEAAEEGWYYSHTLKSVQVKDKAASKDYQVVVPMLFCLAPTWLLFLPDVISCAEIRFTGYFGFTMSE